MMTKLGLRRLWFQVHKWIGLILAILIIPLSLSGAALVWDEPLDRMLNPDRYAVSGARTIDPQRYVAAAKAALRPGERIVSLQLPAEGGPVIVQASQPVTAGRPAAGPPQRTSLYLDPPDARLLARSEGGGFVRFMHQLHGSLMVPGAGRAIVGWLGVAMAISCLTGLWLWWPVTGSIRRGLRWRRQRGTDANLHHQLGFWIVLPLFVLSVTGVWIAAPQMLGGGVGGSGGGQRGGGRDRLAMMRAQPLDTPRLTLDTAIASAQAKLPGDVRQIGWPTDMVGDWQVTVAGPGGPRTVAVPDAGGDATLQPPREQGGVAGVMRRIHDGQGLWFVWQTIIFIGGIIPAVLAVTGIIMWWRARRWRMKLKQRRAAAV